MKVLHAADFHLDSPLAGLPADKLTAWSGRIPITDWLGPVIPRSVQNPSPWGNTRQSAVGTWVWVPHVDIT